MKVDVEMLNNTNELLAAASHRNTRRASSVAGVPAFLTAVASQNGMSHSQRFSQTSLFLRSSSDAGGYVSS